jgi:hypothetical protein
MNRRSVEVFGETIERLKPIIVAETIENTIYERSKSKNTITSRMFSPSAEYEPIV